MKLVVLFLAITSAVILKASTSMPRIIIHVDPGADDAFALLILLHAEKVGRAKIEAIVCTMGNSDVDNTCKNVVRVLEAVNRTDVPVFKGASKPIVPLPKDLPGLNFFGKDGFGDLEHEKEPNLGIIQDIPASIAINTLVSSNPKQITLVCLSPLTTTALTMLLYEDFAQKLKQIWIMGGNYEGPGNITDEAEFNFYIDPESANVLLHNGSYPVRLLTWQTCLKVGITMDWRFNILGKKRSLFMDLLNDVERKVYSNTTLTSDWYQCDAFTTIAAIHEEIILNTSLQKVRVELHDQKTRGKLIIDDLNVPEVNVNILEKVNATIIKEILLEAADNM